jgi:hypothetical protein
MIRHIGKTATYKNDTPAHVMHEPNTVFRVYGNDSEQRDRVIDTWMVWSMFTSTVYSTIFRDIYIRTLLYPNLRHCYGWLRIRVSLRWIEERWASCQWEKSYQKMVHIRPISAGYRQKPNHRWQRRIILRNETMQLSEVDPAMPCQAGVIHAPRHGRNSYTKQQIDVTYLM